MNVTMTATIGGKRTNRVKISRPRRVRAAVAPKRYRKDKSTRGKPYGRVQICLPIAELVNLDAFAERVQMARSHAVRQAIKHFIEWVNSPGDTL